MRTAFWRGVALLNESASDVGQCLGPSAGPSGTLEDTKGFTEFPKNATLLRPVMSKLMEKVAQSVIGSASANISQDRPEGASSEWLSKAREHAQLLKELQLKRKKQSEELLGGLEDEIALVDFLLGENGKE
jgi:hypothetical protein